MNGQLSYEIAKMRIADDHHWAEQQRLARRAREAHKAAHNGEERHGIGFSLRRLITHPSWT